MTSPPIPTPIYRIMLVDNLHTCMSRGGLHAPKHVPNDGLPYRTIHNLDIQSQRRITAVPTGPGGCIHDYVPFYFGYLSPMLFQLKTGRVPGYDQGQGPIVYLVSTVQAVQASGAQFAFSDGHGIAAFTNWFSNLSELDNVDWEAVNLRYWRDTPDDMDRQRRKQAEFLVHRFLDWSLIQEIGVIDESMKARAEVIQSRFPADKRRLVNVRRDWYY